MVLFTDCELVALLEDDTGMEVEISIFTLTER
jgi:hypothetical protein